MSVSLLRQRLEELRSQIDTTRSRATQILSLPAGDLTEALNTEATQLRQELVALHTRRGDIEGQIAEEEADETRQSAATAARVAAGTVEAPEARGVGGARVTSEERTYTADKDLRGAASFFADAYRASMRNDAGAQQRLGRHAREIEVEGEAIETRATTTTSYAGLVVPQYLVDLFAPVLRNGRPLANRVNRLPLPPQGMTLDVPRGTTGAAAAAQATQNSALQSTDQVWTDLVVPVVTTGGQQDVSRQSLERGTPGMDSIVYMDLARAYNAEVDRQVATGTGASGQMLGILNTGSVYQASAYTAAATAATFYSKTAGAVAAVAGAGTDTEPNVWFMHPRRWYWLESLLDSQGRPLVVPNANGVFNALGVNLQPGGYSGANADSGEATPVGVFHGLPVYIDANMPTAVGTGPEDVVLVADTTKAYLWEDNGGIPRQLQFEQTLGQNLTVKLVLFNYTAFTAGRYPAGFGLVGGNSASTFGQVAPTF